MAKYFSTLKMIVVLVADFSPFIAALTAFVYVLCMYVCMYVSMYVLMYIIIWVDCLPWRLCSLAVCRNYT
jgi:hypothetical protein